MATVHVEKVAVKAKKAAPVAAPVVAAKLNKIREWATIPKSVQALIQRANDIEEQIVHLKMEFQESLVEIRNTLNADSFAHPERGEMTIMSRRGNAFWRTKPVWSAEARAEQQAKRKAATQAA